MIGVELFGCADTALSVQGQNTFVSVRFLSPRLPSLWALQAALHVLFCTYFCQLLLMHAPHALLGCASLAGAHTIVLKCGAQGWCRAMPPTLPMHEFTREACGACKVANARR